MTVPAYATHLRLSSKSQAEGRLVASLGHLTAALSEMRAVSHTETSRVEGWCQAAFSGLTPAQQQEYTELCWIGDQWALPAEAVEKSGDGRSEAATGSIWVAEGAESDGQSPAYPIWKRWIADANRLLAEGQSEEACVPAMKAANCLRSINHPDALRVRAWSLNLVLEHKLGVDMEGLAVVDRDASWPGSP